MPSTAPDKTRTEDSLYDAILDDISCGRLEGGKRLKITELADHYGVSASPVREVLRKMQGEGFVEIHPNRGAVVKRTDASTLQNVFEVLRLLEPYFVGWFAEYAPADVIDELAAIQEDIRNNIAHDTIKFRKLDAKFHGLIYAHHYNDVATDTWRRLRTALNVHSAPLRIGPARLDRIIQEHDALIAAFRAHDATEATRVINQHLDGSFMQMSQQMRALIKPGP